MCAEFCDGWYMVVYVFELVEERNPYMVFEYSEYVVAGTEMLVLVVL